MVMSKKPLMLWRLCKMVILKLPTVVDCYREPCRKFGVFLEELLPVFHMLILKVSLTLQLKILLKKMGSMESQPTVTLMMLKTLLTGKEQAVLFRKKLFLSSKVSLPIIGIQFGNCLLSKCEDFLVNVLKSEISNFFF